MIIMLVEDNKIMRDLIRQIIDDEIQDVDTYIECENGLQAVRQYEEKRPDWVLMDIQMEEMDGLTASRMILWSFPDAKIVIVTQYDDPLYRRTAKEIGVTDYILKENLIELPEIFKGA
jgi:DNA-binding NarL/FixJ family response regulator